MKLINDEKGYTTSIIVLILLIPLTMLMIMVIEEYSHDANQSIQTIESEKIKSKTEDFTNEISIITKESLHNITLDVVTKNNPLTNSRIYLKEYIQRKVNQKEEEYKKDNIIIDTEIKSLDSSNDPFKIQINYHTTTTMTNSNIIISKDENKQIEITDNKYPVYDPLPILKTGATFENNYAHFQDKLSRYLNSENSDAYLNTITFLIIKKCPYDDYTEHAHSNQTFYNCLKNHYYHNSHDGMCLLCRLENKTSCNHYGFESFIIPTVAYDKAPASIDHVLLNDKNSHYNGDKILVNNQTPLYLDNGHKSKYGL